MTGTVAIEEPDFKARQVTLRDGREVLIRAGEPGDAAELLAYMHRCLPNFSPYIGMDVDEFTHTEESERDWLAQQQEVVGAVVVLAFEGKRIVGIINCSCASHRRRLAHIGHIGMSSDQSYWGSGLGGAMMKALIDWSERHPALELLELDVYADNKRAIKLYEGVGFVKAGEVSRRAKFADGTYKSGVFMYRRVDGTLSDQPGPNDFNVDLGDGVLLRQLRYGDAQQLFELYVNNRDHLRPYFRWPLTVKSVGQVRGAIAELYELFASERRVTGVLEEGGKLLGLVFMNAHHNPDDRRTELGYWLDAGAQGRGLMTRGCGALVRYAFKELKMNRVDITIDVHNERSIRVAERLGFTREAVIKQWLYFEDGDRYQDMANYRLLREAWNPEDAL